MRVRIVGPPESDSGQFLITYVIDDVLAVDAGCLGSISPVERQHDIAHVLLTHSHVDHIAGLPIFLDNVYSQTEEPPTVWACRDTLDALRRHVFNDALWPDLSNLGGKSAFARFSTLTPHEPLQVGHLTVTPIPLDHTVPTLGLVVDDNESAVVFVSDTRPTSRIWEVAGANARVRGVFLEASFPNELEWLAQRSMHLTPTLFSQEIEKAGLDCAVVAVHLKPAYRDQIVQQLLSLGIERLTVGTAGAEYTF